MAGFRNAKTPHNQQKPTSCPSAPGNKKCAWLLFTICKWHFPSAMVSYSKRLNISLFDKVGRREKKGEDSAWTLCFRQGGGNHEKHEKHERDNNRTTNGHEWTRISFIHEAVPLIMYIFRVFRAFRGLKMFISVHSCPLVVQMFYLFVSFSVHSWFNFFVCFVVSYTVFCGS